MWALCRQIIKLYHGGWDMVIILELKFGPHFGISVNVTCNLWQLEQLTLGPLCRWSLSSLKKQILEQSHCMIWVLPTRATLKTVLRRWLMLCLKSWAVDGSPESYSCLGRFLELRWRQKRLEWNWLAENPSKRRSSRIEPGLHPSVLWFPS